MIAKSSTSAISRLRYNCRMEKAGQASGKYMGIDYGKKRIGIALSDEEGKVAFPKVVLQNSGNAVTEVENICREENVVAIVLGESKDFSGKDNPLMKQILSFKEELGRKSGLHIYLEPEFYTSLEAERLQGKTDMHDASAAALILKSFLDKKNGADNN